MADELTLTARIDHTKAPKGSWLPDDNFTADQTGTGANSVTIQIGTSEEDVNFTSLFPDLTTPGIIVIENLDDTNYVTWGPKDTTMKVIGRIKAGDFPAIFRFESGATLRMKADTAAVFLQIRLYED